ncbi:hypothetical protein DF186_20745, partial [Enterococcus hirae]
MKRSASKFLPFLFLLFIAISTACHAQTCPDDALALTPATLQEEWAVEWWMPRHEAKLTEEGREDARLLFI